MTVTQSYAATPQSFIGFISETFNALTQQQDLSPRNERVTELLSVFVQAVLDMAPKFEAEKILSQPSVRALRAPLLQKLSHAEYEMERYFGEIFAAKGPMTSDQLGEFWYRDNYKDLVAQEVAAMSEAGLEPFADKTMVFVGSGPLPMTAIDMHLQTRARIICVDNDDDAVRLSQAMIDNLGLSSQITVCQAAGEDFCYKGADIVFVASLVGQKDNVIAQIRDTAPEAHIGVRSVDGLKALLYEPVRQDAFLSHGYAYRGKTIDGAGTINTTLLFTPLGNKARPCADRKLGL